MKEGGGGGQREGRGNRTERRGDVGVRGPTERGRGGSAEMLEGRVERREDGRQGRKEERNQMKEGLRGKGRGDR